MTYDICIIGGGPGGYTAAIKGAQLGGKVALVEKEALGGTCLNHGCIPTKNLYSVSEMIRNIKESSRLGLQVSGLKFDMDEIQDKKTEVVEHLKGGIYKLFKDHGIDLYEGKGSISGEGSVVVERPSGTQVLETKNIIIASGSEASDIPPLRIDGKKVLGNREVLSLRTVPERMTIVGGGPIGCEFANIFSRLGSEVTLVEVMDRLLPFCEKEISRIVKKRFEDMGVKVILGSGVDTARISEKEVVVNLTDGSEIESSVVLMAVGRRLNSFNLGLEEAGIEMDGNAVKVDDRMETSLKSVYAVGDVTGRMALAHVAAHQGKIAAENALGGDCRMDYSVIPWAVFINPEVASVGRSEESLKNEGVSYQVGRFPYLANGKAVAMREEDGFVKVLASSEDKKVLGVHILGAHASDMVAEAALAMKMGCTIEDISDTIHAHPTLAETLLEAAEDTEGLAIHKMGRRSR